MMFFNSPTFDVLAIKSAFQTKMNVGLEPNAAKACYGYFANCDIQGIRTEPQERTCFQSLSKPTAMMGLLKLHAATTPYAPWLCVSDGEDDHGGYGLLDTH